jgi:putative secretion ATPase (PEP-CTERM system associated)
MYIEHFGLTGQPFQLTPDARFWFESRTHRKAMAYLGYGLAQGEGFITITGEIGAGKSTLVAHLMATIDRSRLNVISLVSTQVEGDDMLRLVAQGVGLATGAVEKARLLDSLEQRLEAELRSGKRTLLIVDEAQNLPVSALEELRMLSNFQVGGRALIQIFLLGQPEFRDKLASAGLEQLRQRVIATHHLEAMAADELDAYVRHRLGVVGWSGRPGFTPAAFAAIHAESGGIPRKVNQLANRLMLHAALGGEGMIGAETVVAVVADLSADSAPAPAREAVLPLGSAKPPLAIPANEPAAEPAAEPQPFVERRRASDAALEREIAALQARAEEQEAMLRRVLTMLIEWVENPEPSFRSHAA